MDKTPITVAFRFDKTGPYKEVTAVFIPTREEKRDNLRFPLLNCYTHIGQHGTCSIGWVLRATRPAKPSDYRKLLRELEGIGYEVTVVATMKGINL